MQLLDLSRFFRSSTVRASRILAIAAAAYAAASGPGLTAETSTLLSSPTGDTTYGETVDFEALVKGAGPTGTVTFLDGSTELGSGPLSLLDAATSIGIMDNHTCALTVAGGVKCWGTNTYGQLGNSNLGTNATTPFPVVGLSSGVRAVSVGAYNSCALTEGGTVKCWGRNIDGQLADGTTNDSDVPVDIAGLPDGITAVSVGRTHICALTNAGAVWCWGGGASGQLGNGTNTNSPVPVPVDGLSSGVAAIAAAYLHTCAITDTGVAKCWGSNGSGRLGDGTTSARNTPVDVIGLPGPVAVISGNQNHTCAVTEAGAAYCWGYGNEGELGDGGNAEKHTPVAVTGLGSGVATIEAGWAHTCAAKEDGSAFCWGYNNYGQLGDGSTTQANTPQPVSDLSHVVALAAGQYHTCALTETGAIKCWGHNASGKLGDGNNPTNSHTPVAVVDFGDGAALLAAETSFSTNALNAGNREIIARYDGDSLNATSTSDVLTQVVAKASTETKVKVKPKKPKEGKSARIKAIVAALDPADVTPDGKVVVKKGRKKLGKFKLKKGKTKIRLRELTPGKYKIKARYKGSDNLLASKGKAKFVVK